MFQEKENKNNLLIQMICDSKGCREVDLLNRPIEPINSELKTLMSPEQLKELADRMPAKDEEIRESSFEVMLEDEMPDYICESDYQKGYNDAIKAALEWLELCLDYHDCGDYDVVSLSDYTIEEALERFKEDNSLKIKKS